jgi:toxin ParE1/3/4
MLIENCRSLSSNPELGKSYSGVMNELSGFKAGRHIIFYRVIHKEEIEIIRILHEKMDIKNRMLNK